jgi:hypothetical protein
MTLETTTAAIRTHARSRKELAPDVSVHSLIVVRDGRVVVQVRSGDAGAVLDAAGIAAAGYRADALAVVIEGVMPLVDTNPVTGQPWESGEAEDVWRDHDGAARGWVTETQILATALRSGEAAEEAWALRAEDDGVRWGENTLDLSATGLTQELAARLANPAADPARVPDPGDLLTPGFAGDAENGPFLPEAEGALRLDAGCTLMLANRLSENGDLLVFAESEDHALDLQDQGVPGEWIELPTGASSSE